MSVYAIRLQIPSKTTYSVNDAIDTSGMKIVATYTDGSKTEVSGWKI